MFEPEPLAASGAALSTAARPAGTFATAVSVWRDSLSCLGHNLPAVVLVSVVPAVVVAEVQHQVFSQAGDDKDALVKALLLVELARLLCDLTFGPLLISLGVVLTRPDRTGANRPTHGPDMLSAVRDAASGMRRIVGPCALGFVAYALGMLVTFPGLIIAVVVAMAADPVSAVERDGRVFPRGPYSRLPVVALMPAVVVGIAWGQVGFLAENGAAQQGLGSLLALALADRIAAAGWWIAVAAVARRAPALVAKSSRPTGPASILRVARAHRAVGWSFVTHIATLVVGVGASALLAEHPGVATALLFATALLAMVQVVIFTALIYRLADALESRWAWAWSLASLGIGCVNMFVFVALLRRARSRLEKAGVRVGLMGPSRNVIDTLERAARA